MRKQLIPVLLVSTLLGIGVGVGVVAAHPHAATPAAPASTSTTAPPATPAPTTPPPGAGPHVMHFSTSQKGRLGIVVLAISPELRAHFGAPDDRGVLVDAVRPDSPAARAGLQVGDVVTDVDGDATTDARDVLGSLADRKKGDDVAITVMRDGKRIDLKAKLENDPDQTASAGTWRQFDNLPDGIDGWFKFDGNSDDMRRSFEEMEKHMRELQRQFGPGASHSNKI